MSFKVGDRVVYIYPGTIPDSNDFGTVTEASEEWMSMYNGHTAVKYDNSCRHISASANCYLIPEAFYNSRLYRALQEEE